jgi:hypothetical protein
MLLVLLGLPAVAAHHYGEWYGYEVSNGVYEILGLIVIVAICVWCMLPWEQEVVQTAWPRIYQRHIIPESGAADVMVDRNPRP